MENALRAVFKFIPHDPRCMLCAAPFAGAGGQMMRLLGKRQSDKNPNWCSACFRFMEKHHGGAEIECTMLFADVRGSTALAEGTSAGAFHELMERYYNVAASTVFENDGIVDKFVGDELVAMFFPLLSGDHHPKCGLAAARALLEATGHADPDGPWISVGAGVHTGIAWVGAVGDGVHTTITALGDAVNTAARLASAAGPRRDSRHEGGRAGGRARFQARAAGPRAEGEAGDRRRRDADGRTGRTGLSQLPTGALTSFCTTA